MGNGAGAAGGAGGAAGAGAAGNAAGDNTGGGGSPAWFASIPDLSAAIVADPNLGKAIERYPSAVDLAKAVTAGWGDQWRENFAGDDKAKLTELQRYATPKAVLEGLFAAKERIRSGELGKPLPENPNEQEIAAYREAHGIPAEPKGYLENLPEGLVIGEDDKPFFEKFAAKLHGINADPKVAHVAISFYNEIVEEQEAAVAEADLAAKQATEDALRVKWGPDFRANQNAIRGFLDTLPQGISETILSARDDQGRALFNVPEFAEWFAGLAREFNPVLAIVPGGGGAPGKSLDDEIAGIEKFMREKRADYNKDEKMQERYRQLLDAKIKRDAKGKAA